MIVKNESHIITETLTKLLLKIKFDYYVICDTGSTDNTIDLIKTFFDKNKINGEIHNHQWKDFGYNRTLALKCAYKKTDYLLIFDADDSIEGDFKLPELKLDSYMLRFGNYERMCLVKNDINWKYIGVLHEYITTEIENLHFTKGNIPGDYYIVSGRTSSRNNDPEKYIKDAKILEDAYYECLKINDPLFNRYVYYCANSYLDAGKRENAIDWYKRTLTSNGWSEEKFNSCLKLYELTNKKEYLVMSYHFNSRRVEGIYCLIRHYTCEGMYTIAMGYYNFIKNYYENEYPLDDLSTKLFANIVDYTFYLPYYTIIVCEKVKDYTTGIKMFDIIFNKKENVGQWWINNLLFNLQFFEFTNLELLKGYINFLEMNGKTVDYTLPHLMKFEKTQNLKKFDLLIYTGFSNQLWNWSYSLTNSLGGSERAVLYLTKFFPKNLSIVITGDVQDEIVDNIHFINRFKIDKSYKFNTIIVSRYVSFFLIFPYLTGRIILMPHDTYFMNNLENSEISPNKIIQENFNKIEMVVYLTEWQKQHYRMVTHPELIYKKNFIINNGILPELFPENVNKIKNTFIYTSGSFRGLERVLELWKDILAVKPDAKLFISSYETFPKNDLDNKLNEIIKSFPDSIKHCGKLNQIDLYNLMGSSHYWLYPCSFDETSCITAMEMLMSEVVCLYYPRAGLTDTISKYGVVVKHGNEIETLLGLKPEKENELKLLGKEYSKNCSWKNRALQWKSLLNFKKRILFYTTENFFINVLEDYFNSLKELYHIDYTTKITDYHYDNYDELIFIYDIFDQSVFGKFKEVNYLNTEPLNLKHRIYYLKHSVKNYIPPGYYEKMKFYDYSMSNIKIMNENGISNTFHLNYNLNDTEKNKLKKLKQENKQIYDYGIICSAGNLTNDISLLSPPRRKAVIEYLISEGFKINIISGYGLERDIELAKCKTILNIHGEHQDLPSKIFEHIRCDRLLDAGYSILSEDSIYFENNFPNLEIMVYDDFFKLKKKQIIDTFIFYNEISLLEYRLSLLKEIVDHFVIVESTLTHVGKPKKMYFDNSKFKNYPIVHVVVEDFPFNENNIDTSKEQQWINEKFQRNCITRGLKLLKIKPDDIVLLSDLDEIPDPLTLKKIKSSNFKGSAQFDQEFYYYNLTCKMQVSWLFAKIFSYSWFLSNNLTLSDIRYTQFETIPYGGWHLSYFGTPKFISNKIKNFAHQEFNKLTFTNVNLIEQRIKDRVDIYNRNIDIKYVPIHENGYLPPNYPFLYCFIHSCNLNNDLTRLNYLVDSLNKSEINFTSIFINNIGKPVDNIEHYSDDPKLFEIPTINKMIEFGKLNKNARILYIHTKGVSENIQRFKEQVDDWIDLMLHFLLKPETPDLLNTYDCVGSLYRRDPLPHFSGNFWWATSEYLSKLEFISENNVNKNDAEYHLFSKCPDYHCLHQTNLDHYINRYPKSCYNSL